MNRDVAIVIFNIVKRQFTIDIEIPLDITANELVIASPKDLHKQKFYE